MSMMVSTDATYALPRYSGVSANPVGNTAHVTRETAPLAAGAPPRVQHPKLNRHPWSTAQAVKRKPAKPKRGTRRDRYNSA